MSTLLNSNQQEESLNSDIMMNQYVVYYNCKLNQYSDEIVALTHQMLNIQPHLRYLNASILLLEDQWKEVNEYHQLKWKAFLGELPVEDRGERHSMKMIQLCYSFIN